MDEGTSDRATKSSRNSLLLRRKAQDGRLDESDRSSRLLGVSSRTLRLAVERRETEAEHPLADGPWVINQRALETEATAKFVERVRRSNRHTTIPTPQQNGFEFSTT